VALVALHNALLLASPSFLDIDMMSEAMFLTALPVGLAVSATRTTLLISGRWRPAACPGDRAGRVLGAFWVGVVPLHLAVLVAVFWR
jgi:hypothetical protein